MVTNVKITLNINTYIDDEETTEEELKDCLIKDLNNIGCNVDECFILREELN